MQVCCNSQNTNTRSSNNMRWASLSTRQDHWFGRNVWSHRSSCNQRVFTTVRAELPKTSLPLSHIVAWSFFKLLLDDVCIASKCRSLILSFLTLVREHSLKNVPPHQGQSALLGHSHPHECEWSVDANRQAVSSKKSLSCLGASVDAYLSMSESMAPLSLYI